MSIENEINNDKILVIDDEWGMRHGVSRILSSDGYQCDMAETGASGLEQFKNTRYNLCLVDLKLPDIDGLSLIPKLLEHDPEAVCIVISAYASVETAISITRRGAFDFLPKPFTPQQLRIAVRRGIRQRRFLLDAKLHKQQREESLLELATERSRIRTIMNTLCDGVVVVNNEGNLALVNPAAYSLLGLQNPQISKNFLEQITDSKLKAALLKMLDEGDDHRMVEIDGITEGQVLSIYSARIPDSHIGEAGRTIVLRDVTHWAELDRTKSNFIRLVSHEVKAPIGAVIGFLELINGNYVKDKDKISDYLHRSTRRLQGLLGMVKDLLSITRMENSGSYMTFEPIKVGEIIEEIVGSLESSMQERNETINMQIDDIPQIWGDETAIFQLITNLVSNAIKYNKESGIITVTAKPAGKGVEIIVADTGIGIPQEQLARIWEPFFRVRDQKIKKISGTGLGLSIVRRIVDNHHGSIEVDSVVNEGTSFKVWLPSAETMQNQQNGETIQNK